MPSGSNICFVVGHADITCVLCCRNPDRVGRNNQRWKSEEKTGSEPRCSGRIWLIERKESDVEN